MTVDHLHRREFLARAGLLGGVALPALASQVLHPSPRVLGAPLRGYGERSRFETSMRTFTPSATPGTGSAKTPLQDLHGIITPSALHFERLHAGVPNIDPTRHELLVHGMVDRPTVFTVEDLLRLPPVSRIHFIECAGNSGREQAGDPGPTPQLSHGLVSCSEWTGVPLRLVLDAVGVRPGARWLLAEGADAGRMSRSLPLDKAYDDVLLAYGQNGEALRPEQGYPLRLVVPGWEGNVNIKWVGRLHVLDQPGMGREGAATYTDLLPDGRARMFTFIMAAKSVITRPAGGQRLSGRGTREITGLAWSGRGRISRVEVSADGGASWHDATLNDPVLPKALSRFSLPWTWQGEEAVLMSRCTDETGYTQPTRERIIAARGQHAGPDGFDHYNGIKAWRVHQDGSVTHV
jgi:sulfane dehydrogenase subunit SoxC